MKLSRFAGVPFAGVPFVGAPQEAQRKAGIAGRRGFALCLAAGLALAPWQSARAQGTVAPTAQGQSTTAPGQGNTAAQGQGTTTQPGAAAAQGGGTVTGQVTATYGEPLSGIAVGVKGSRQQRVRTDARGNFTLTGLPPGSHTIEASAQGFISQTEQVTVTEGAPASVTFSLDPDLLGSEEIVVTAQTPDRKVRSSTAITTATAEDIQIRMPRNTADLLRIVPGFYTESSGGEVGGNVFVRGLPADGSYRYVAMMEDGMPVFDSTELFFVNNDIFVRVDENIERMEAVRGGTSALYGSNAPGGVINFLNKHGGDKLAATIRATTATSGLFRYDANVNGPIGDDWRFSAGGFYRYDEGIRNPGFPASHGGQFKGSLTRLITGDKLNGHARVTFKYLNDRNTFYLPLPFRGRFNSGGRLEDHQFVDGFPTDGTLTSREGVNAEVPLPGGGQLNLPLQNGQQQIGASTMAELRLYFPETRLEVQNHTRLMQMDHSWNAMLPFELRNAGDWARSVVGAGTPYRITCSQVQGAPEFGGPGCPSENNLVALGG
ncbi:MAG TPA: TonB-dependent receptor, partial [Myxococcaceae bacterium]|nr:TonB-dependent receptor [Myxococcaceae bacterium]